MALGPGCPPLEHPTLDLSTLEIRGSKPGITNARSTGPLLNQGTYIPNSGRVGGTAFFSSSSDVVSSIAFNPPNASLDTYNLFKIGDSILVNNESFFIEEILSATSIRLDSTPSFDGSYNFCYPITMRDYLVESDAANNIVVPSSSSETATFSSGSDIVNGTGTSWLGVLEAGDEIRLDADKVFYTIDNVISNVQLQLTENYAYAGGTGSYMAKKTRIGNMYYRYTKHYFEFDKFKARWVPELYSDTGRPTTDYFSPLEDGIEIQFSPTQNAGDPDMLDIGSVVDQVLVESLPRDAFEYSLPTVPIEGSLELKVNDIAWVEGEDYLINYHSDPFYLPPPPVDERLVANVMPLDEIDGQVMIASSNGLDSQAFFTKENGSGATEQVVGLASNSETVSVNGSPLSRYVEYVPSYDPGIIDFVQSNENEPLVRYVFAEKDFIDDGFDVYRNGVCQVVNFPSQEDDDLVFEIDAGVFTFVDPLGPNDEALFIYQVESATTISDEILVEGAVGGETIFNTQIYPIKDLSAIILKVSAGTSSILEVDVDYRISYQTGRIILFNPLLAGDQLNISYTPLSKQINGMTFESGEYFCTVYDEPLEILDPSILSFRIINPSIVEQTTDPRSNADVLRVRKNSDGTSSDQDFDLTNMEVVGPNVKLDPTYNPGISITADSDVRITYKYQSDSVAYVPVLPNYTTLPEGFDKLYLDNQDRTSNFIPGAITRFRTTANSNAYFFRVQDSIYDGTDTIVTFTSTYSDNIRNPFVGVTDDVVVFDNMPTTHDIAQGAAEILIAGNNLSGRFRPGVVLEIGGRNHGVTGNVFEDGTNIVSITPETVTDYLAGETLYYSDYPIYGEGDTVVSTFFDVIEDPSQPAFSVSYDGTASSAKVSTDKTSIQVITTVGTTDSVQVFSYDSYPTVSLISTAVDAVPGFNTVPYVSDWSSAYIQPLEETAVTSDTSALFSVDIVVRKDGSDTTNYQIDGDIILTTPLVEGDRYNIDYMGREFLNVGDQVTGSARYFTSLREGSKIEASFDYFNPDQFYIQVMSQQHFLDNVIVPRLEEERAQAAGQIGQGIDITEQSEGNDQGGLTDIYYQQRDIEIECRIYDKTFDFYNLRAINMGIEMANLSGPVLFNNDGPLDEDDQSMATKSFSRQFPRDYTELPPLPISATAGVARGPGSAAFSNGSANVAGTDTIWDEQLKDNDFIRAADSTRQYKISSVNSDVSLTLDTAFEEDNYSGDFIITSRYPVFDDDGFTGAKVVGTKYNEFDLVDGDIFDTTANGEASQSTFEDPPTPLNLLYPLSNITATEAASQLNQGLSGVAATAEDAYFLDEPYGMRTTISLRVDEPSSYLFLGKKPAVEKLGFTPDTEYAGSDNTFSEKYIAPEEKAFLVSEVPLLSSLIAAGIPNKLARITLSNVEDASSLVEGIISQEVPLLERTEENVEAEIEAAEYIVLETSIEPAYTDTSAALLEHYAFLGDTTFAKDYATDLSTDYDGYVDATSWVASYENGTQFLSAAGQDYFDVFVDSAVDERILQNAIPDLAGSIAPTAIYSSGPDSGSPVPGTWPATSFQYGYSIDSSAIFLFSGVIDLFGIYKTSISIPVINYNATPTALTIDWTDAGSPNNQTFTYSSYTTVGSLRSAIGALTNIATSNLGQDAVQYGALLVGSGSFTNSSSPGFPMKQGLKGNVQASYSIISDKNLSDRNDFNSARQSTLDDRITFASDREDEIRAAVDSENFFVDDEGNPGQIYTWSNARYHRRNGCEARLIQINQQIKTNNETVAGNSGVINSL